MSERPKVVIYTDGGCEPNPGVGGWAALLIFDDVTKELSGGELDSTNNRMELTAVITALESLPSSHEVDLYTDSQYVQKGITEWIKTWIRKNWRGVKNPDLWQRLHDATQRHRIKWHWVKGHAGNEHNERVDRLAMSEIRKLRGEAPLVGVKSPSGLTIRSTSHFGSWVATITDDQGEKKLSGSESEANPYKMALLAAISALELIQAPSNIVFYTDNEILQKGITRWIQGWLKNGWRSSTGEPVKYKEQWIRLYNASRNHQISWKLQA